MLLTEIEALSAESEIIFGGQVSKTEAIVSQVMQRAFEKRLLYWALNNHQNSRGEAMTFDGLDYLLKLYLKVPKYEKVVIEKSVQMGISELLIIKAHIEAAELGKTVLYVLPKYELRNRFVNNRIRKLHARMPAYAALVRDSVAQVHNVGLMHLGAGTIAFVGSNVESEFIEIPADSVIVDEKDRCHQDNLTLLPDRIAASNYRRQCEVSNPTIEGYAIDERYIQSTQALWNIKCPHCASGWFNPDFFSHVIEQTDSTSFRVRDPEWEPSQEPRLIHTCGKPVNRLSQGAWVETVKGKDWRGFRISKLYGRFTRLREMVQTYQEAQGNARKTQVFYNSELGLPYTAKGAKVTRTALDACRRQFYYPAVSVMQENPRFMGVDVGSDLSVVIRERIREKGTTVLRLILAATVPGYSTVAKLIQEWRPLVIVVDALPEIHKNQELKADFSNVWTSSFQQDVSRMSVNRKFRELKMDRTAILDSVHASFNQQVLLLPMMGDQIDEGRYYREVMASTRVLEVSETNREKTRFTWVHSRPDHYFLAEAYCMQAWKVGSSDAGVFDFFEEQAEVMAGRSRDAVINSADFEVEPENVVGSASKPLEITEVDRMLTQTPESVLGGIRKKNLEVLKLEPKINHKKIRRICQELLKLNGYTDIKTVMSGSGCVEDDALVALKQLGMIESKIKGQWIL